MKPPKILAIIGLVLLILGVMFFFFPATQEVWKEKSHVLLSETIDVSSIIGCSRMLTYLFLDPEDVRNLKITGYVEKVTGNNFSFQITDGKVYVEADNVMRYDFDFIVEPEELTDGLWLKIEPTETKVSIYAKATWEEKTYAHVLGGMVLGGILGFFGLVALIAAFVLYLVRRPKIKVVVEKKNS